MKNLKGVIGKIAIVFCMALMVGVLGSSNVFASDDYEVGTTNLNNTPENSAKVGYLLPSPEKGWKRYDDRNSNIEYDRGNGDKVVLDSYSSCYNGTRTWTYQNSNGSAKFKFTGNKIRIINDCNTNYSFNYKINIDGINYPYSLRYSDSGNYLVFQKLDLSSGEHYVEMKEAQDASGLGIMLDAIDIDVNGQLKPYNENVSTIISNISLNKITDNFQVGQTDQLTATIKPDNATNKTVIWKSSDESIATVDSTGKVTAIKEGTTTITATTTDGSNLSASCKVTVTT